ncbi:coiled-coil domain-containing protein 150 [Brachyistius frenatus]|uniref:coiled-coil domain-containing protein 150 n=1 Tax=Brachyistius frenatus TaxID=100188 RepID=UPI0037E855C0
MKEQMRQESVRFHGELLQRVEEAEGAVEMETRQALLLQSRSQTLCAEVQSGRQQLVEEKHRGRQLEECCQLLRQQTAMKDSLLRELKTKLKKQQTENGELLKESRELRAAADRVQAERSRVVEQLQEQDLLLDAARRSIQTELQVALADNDRLEKELEKLKAEHTHLLQSSAITQETAVNERKLLQRTAERLQGELSTVRKEEAAMRKDLEGSKNELSLVVTKLEAERNTLDAQLREARISELQAWKSIYGPAEGVVSKTLDDILASSSRLQLNSQTLHQEGGGREEELATLKQDRLQAHREIRKHQAEVEKLQRLLTSAHCKSNRALESLQKALVTAREDNKRLALSLEQTVLTNSSLHRKMDRAEDQYRATITQRDDELREARTNISYLSTDLSSAKQQSREDYESSMKTLQREVSELKMTVKDSSTKSSDVSKTNQELHRRVCELERLVSRQKACIREQRSQLKRQQESRELQDGSRRVQRLEERTGSPHEKEHVDRKLQVRVDSEQVLSKREAERERWTSTIQRWEAKRELARSAGGDQPVRTKLITQLHR